MANYSKLKVIWRNNLNNIYKENTIIGVGQEAVINIDENSISTIYVNFKVNNDFFADLVEINGNVIQVPFKTDVLKEGTHQLEIVAHLKNGDIVPSPTFSYYVEKSLENADAIKADTHYPILIELLEKVEEWNEGAVYQEEQRIANENERKSNEINRQSNENTRINNENTRQSNESNRQQYETQRRVEEDERLTDEQVRVNAENIRIANENERLRKEIERQNAEELRQIAYNSLYGRIDETEDRLNEAIEEVHNAASTMDSKIAQSEANMTAQVDQGKADMEAMVAEVEAELEGLHAKDEEISEQLAQKANTIDMNSKVWSMANMGQDVKEAMTGGSVAVVGENSILLDNLTDNLKLKLGFELIDELNFTIGSLSSGQLRPDKTDRLVSNRVYLEEGTNLSVDYTVTDYSYVLYSEDRDDTFVKDNGWQYGKSVTLSESGYYRILLRDAVTNSTITDADSIVSGFSLNGVSKTTNKRITIIETQLKEILPSIEEIETQFEQGLSVNDEMTNLMNELGYELNNTEETEELTFVLGSHKNGVPRFDKTDRLISNRVYLKEGTTLSTNSDNTDYAYLEYAEDTDESFVSDSGWQYGVSVTLSKSSYYRIVLRDKVTNSTITDIDSVVSGFVLTVNEEVTIPFQTPSQRFEKTETRLEEIESQFEKTETRLEEIESQFEKTETDLIKNPLNANVKAIMHRGYSTVAPENTLSAFKLAYEKGFSYVEADIRCTSDGVPVLIHDSTIDRTSTGSGSISELTLEEVRQYDFGSWKDEKYANEKIPTLEEFLILCKKLNLHPYLDISTDVNIVLEVVRKSGMIKNVTFLLGSITSIQTLLNSYKYARVCMVAQTFTQEIVDQLIALKTDFNDVFVDTNYNRAKEAWELVLYSLQNDLPVEVWTWEDNENIVVPAISNGVSGITADSLNIAEILKKSI